MNTSDPADDEESNEVEELFATKKVNAWFWSGGYSRKDLQSRLATKRLARDWLVCPIGESNNAVTLGELIDDPKVFVQRKERANKRRKAEVLLKESIAKPRLLRIGQNLLMAFFVCLILGRLIVAWFFPTMVGSGLKPTALMILIPIWTIGAAALIAIIIGWFQHRYRVRAALMQPSLLTDSDAAKAGHSTTDQK